MTTFGWAIVGSRLRTNLSKHSPAVAAMLACCAVKKIQFSSELEEKDDATAAEKPLQVAAASVGAAVEECTEDVYDKAGVGHGLNAAKTPVKTSVHKNLKAAETAADSSKENEEILQVGESLQTNKDDEINTVLKAFWEVALKLVKNQDLVMLAHKAQAPPMPPHSLFYPSLSSLSIRS